MQKKIIFSLTFLIFLTFIVYLPSLYYAFQFDDGPNIVRLFDVRNLGFSDLCFSSTRWISYWLNTFLFKLGNFDPFYYRLANLSFHILTGILIYIFMHWCKFNKMLALLVTALFLLHPVQTQTVSYIIQGQLEGLAALFIMSMLLCAIFILQAKHKAIWVILFSLITIFSTGTKEIIVVTPILILLTDWFFISHGNWQKLKRHIWLPVLNFILIVLTYAYIKPWFLMRMLNLNYVCANNPGNLVTSNAQETITVGAFFISQFKVLLHYLWIYIWPFNISVEYDWKLVQLSSFDFIAPFIIILLILSAIIYLLKDRTSVIAFGLLWFFVLNLPRASIIPSSELVADYKTYLASFGWLLVIGIVIFYCLEFICVRFPRHARDERGGDSVSVRLDGAKRVERCERGSKIFVISLALLPLALGYLTYNRNKVWRSGLEFWENIIKNAPNKARAYNNYAVELSKNHKFKEAIPYYKRAIRLEGATYYDPYTNLAGAYAVLGDTDLAIETLQQSLQINAMQPEAYNNLGAFYLHKQEFAKAEECCNKAISLNSHYGRAMYNLGKLYFAQENYQKSWEYFKKACTESDIDCDLPPLVAYAELSVNLGKIDDAKFACKRIIDVAPKSQEAQIARDVLKSVLTN